LSGFADRPWGRLDWVLDRLDPSPWHLISCRGTEDRCFAVLRGLAERNLVSDASLIDIAEPDGHPRSEDIARLKEVRSNELEDGDLSEIATEIFSHRLLEPFHLVVEQTKAIAAAHPRIVLDITALPKRFFFPMLKMILASEALTDLVVTYSMAESYASQDLHQDIQSPEFLPLFPPDLGDNGHSAESLIVSVGFESSGVIQILEESDYSPVTVLFSYPAPPPFFGRNWDFLRHASRSVDRDHLTLKGISAFDVASVFETLKTTVLGGGGMSVCAPFGPKPVSLAMALFVIGPGSGRSAVTYTQPKYYNPDYSQGVLSDPSGSVIYAYPIVLGGNRFFEQ